ncbi:sortase A [Leucobacter luti]|uniref:Sortase A n=1 Tax=Leucobacter luti TaxID=340320 RepID=A0A4R6S3F2_9MICO|nr:class E sortase [Leucobacter luti]MCW2289355.1 sortase A [Leucobacter luti]TCK39915.1 sortase A [Leucobacter luti]TDP93226.1 sortase A [Leucobacter luti]
MTDTSGRRNRRRRARLSPLTVLGELLLVAGIGVLGYIVWQPWHTGVTVTAKQTDLSAQTSAQWDAEAQPLQTEGVPVTAVPEKSEVFATLHAPAFGTTYANRIGETTDWWTVLNLDEKGIGHYETTQMPGEPGNFALAGHRSGPLINSFREVMNLRVGDPLFIETADGWYTYRFRSIEYVLPTETDVLNPFPRLEGQPGVDQIMTLTTCHPKWAGSDERAIAYSVFEGFQPRSDGPPAELLELNPALKGAAS